MSLPGWDADQEHQGIHFSVAVGSEMIAAQVTQRAGEPPWQNRSLWKHHLTVFPKLSYLLVGVRPVKAQEKVGGLAVQKEVGCPEWNGEALDGVAEVERGPEVLGVSICENVLRGKERGSEQAWPGP